MQVTLGTNLGNITIELYEDKAPKTVENFLGYVSDGFYDGTLFHRVIEGFMIQGGGFEPGMVQKPTGPTIENEANNGLGNRKGAVAMARTPEPHSASAQFFINVNDNDFLDFRAKSREGWGYCVFGQVVDGMDVVSSIETSRTVGRAGHSDVPAEDVVINRATRVDG